jgi:hypothetical protein
MNTMKNSIPKLSSLSLIILLMASFMGCSESLEDGGLLIGWAMEDITPQLPASMRGQYYERIAEEVQSPLQVIACAMESNSENGVTDIAILVSLEAVSIQEPLLSAIRKRVKAESPHFETDKIVVNATHVHTAPNPVAESEFGKLIIEKASKAIISAWKNRSPAGISSEMGFAVVGHNRRARYSDGTAQMYGSTDRPDFIGMEGGNDTGVEMIFCWDLHKQLTGIIMNVSCPAQIMEAKSVVSSDYWGEVRKQLNEKYPGKIHVLGQCGAGGDISPRDLTRKYRAGEPNMWDVPGIVEIGRRLVKSVEEAYPSARESIQTKPVLEHSVRMVDLPERMYSDEEYAEAKSVVDEIMAREPSDPDSPNSAWNKFLADIRENEKNRDYGPWDNKLLDFGQLKKKQALMEKYENQKIGSSYSIEVHVLRLGDAVIATNPFELYLDYASRITGQSQAKHTLIVQLCCGGDGYLPTRTAISGGGYSAMVNKVGPLGGQVLVDKTVEEINDLFD